MKAVGHDYLLVSAHGDDAPSKSLDEYRYCSRCGTLRHDYRHNGGQTSPNFPMFCAVGQKDWGATEPPCLAAGARTITVHDRCTVEGCNRVLHTIAEGERGTCSSCWVKAMRPETKKAMNRLIASAFNGSSDAEKDAAVEDALAKLRADENAKP